MIVSSFFEDLEEVPNEEQDEQHLLEDDNEEEHEHEQEHQDIDNYDDGYDDEEGRMWTIEMTESQNKIYYNLPSASNTTNDNKNSSSRQRMTAIEICEIIRGSNNWSKNRSNCWCFHFDPFLDHISNDDLHLLCGVLGYHMEELQILFLGGVWDHQQVYQLFQQLFSLASSSSSSTINSSNSLHSTLRLKHLIIEWVHQGNFLKTLHQLANNNDTRIFFLSLRQLSLFSVNFPTTKDCHHFATTILQQKGIMPQLQHLSLCSCHFPSLKAFFYIIDGLSTRAVTNTIAHKIQKYNNSILSGSGCTVANNNNDNNEQDHDQNDSIHQQFPLFFPDKVHLDNDDDNDMNHKENVIRESIPLKQKRFLQLWYQSNEKNNHKTKNTNDRLFVTANQYFGYRRRLSRCYLGVTQVMKDVPQLSTNILSTDVTNTKNRKKRILHYITDDSYHRRPDYSNPVIMTKKSKRQRVRSWS